MPSLRRRRPADTRRHRDVLELTCVVDGRSHTVPLDAVATSADAGGCRAACGHVVIIGSMASPPGPACPACGESGRHAS